MLSKCGNELKWEVLQENLSYTSAAFVLCRGVYLALTLLEERIRATVWSDKTVESEQLRCAIRSTRESLRDLFLNFEMEDNDTLEVMCPHMTKAEDCLVRIKGETNEEDDEIEFIPQHHKCIQHSKSISKENFEWLNPAMDNTEDLCLTSWLEGKG